jgi:hypothetical protein
MGNSLQAFLLPGWIVEEQAAGDLNGDGVSDFAAILVQGKPDFDKDGIANERQRGLIVLVSNKKVFTFAESMMTCSSVRLAEGMRRITLSKKKGRVPRNTPFIEDVTPGNLSWRVCNSGIKKRGAVCFQTNTVRPLFPYPLFRHNRKPFNCYLRWWKPVPWL